MDKFYNYLLIALAILPALAAIATAFVGVWHALVILLTALSLVPGLGALRAIADKLSVQEASITDAVNNTILPFLNRLSGIALPKKV